MVLLQSGPQQATASPVLDFSLLLFRVGCSLLLIVAHGWSNAALAWNHLWKSAPWPLIDQLEAAGFPWPALSATVAAVACSTFPLGIILGFLSRLFSLFILAVLLVAYFAGNSPGDPMRRELIVLYMLAFGFILIQGGGRFGIDRLFRRGPRQGRYR